MDARKIQEQNEKEIAEKAIAEKARDQINKLKDFGTYKVEKVDGKFCLVSDEYNADTDPRRGKKKDSYYQIYNLFNIKTLAPEKQYVRGSSRFRLMIPNEVLKYIADNNLKDLQKINQAEKERIENEREAIEEKVNAKVNFHLQKLHEIDPNAFYSCSDMNDQPVLATNKQKTYLGFPLVEDKVKEIVGGPVHDSADREKLKVIDPNCYEEIKALTDADIINAQNILKIKAEIEEIKKHLDKRKDGIFKPDSLRSTEIENLIKKIDDISNKSGLSFDKKFDQCKTEVQMTQKKIEGQLKWYMTGSTTKDALARIHKKYQTAVDSPEPTNTRRLKS